MNFIVFSVSFMGINLKVLKLVYFYTSVNISANENYLYRLYNLSCNCCKMK